jgi:adenosine deaminase
MTTRPLDLLPKVHVHAHLDGSYPRPAVEALATAQGASFGVPARFGTVWDFFDAYGTVPALVRDLEDLRALCHALVQAEAAAGVLYFEPAIEPQLYAPRLGSLERVTQAILDALGEAATDTGIAVGANLTVNTDQDEPIAGELAAIAARHADHGITAFGTAGFEEPAGLVRFARAACVAKEAGLQVVAHAGQTGGPESIREALDVIGATRISHGVTAVRDPDLLARLAQEQIVLDVCPTSNVALGIVPSLAEHPVPALVRAGVPVTLNADDALWFSHDVTGQYGIARDIWGFDDDALARLAGNGLLVPGLKGDARMRFQEEIAAW